MLYEDPNPIEVGAVDAGVAGNVVNTILTGYMQRFTKIKTVGLCHSVQVCSERLLKDLGIEDRLAGRIELIEAHGEYMKDYQ